MWSTILFRQSTNGRDFSLSQVVPCNPETSDAGPKRARKDRQWMEEAIVDNLVKESEDDVRPESEEDVAHCELGYKGLSEAHGVWSGVITGARHTAENETEKSTINQTIVPRRKGGLITGGTSPY